MSISADQVIDYLREHPSFFERHPGLLTLLSLPNAHAGKAMSLHERQLAVMRDKQKALESVIINMRNAASENLVIVNRMQSLHRDLMRTRDARDLPAVLVERLASLFSVPTVRLMLWAQNCTSAPKDFQADVSSEGRALIENTQPLYCGTSSGWQLDEWFGEQAGAVQSMVILPLRVGIAPESFGVLLLGSPDAGRFSADMGQDFLLTLAESASASLSRLLD